MNGRLVLDDLSMSILDGSLTAVIGPSGSGKSTILRLISGLLSPERGSVTIGGIPVDTRSPANNRVAMVFQGEALYDHLTVGRNLEFPWRMQGHSGRDASVRGMAVASKLGVRRLWSALPRSLSGGERGQVATARALSRTNPSVVLLDEPLSGADDAVRRRFRSEIVGLHRDSGVTFVIATNDQSEAMAVATHVAVLRDGSIEQFDSPGEIYRNPSSAAVAAFVGSPPMNLFPARNLGDGMVEIGRDRLSVGGSGRYPAQLLVGLHPSDLEIAHPATPFERTFRAVLGRVDDLGPYALGHFGLGVRGVGFAVRLPTGRYQAGDLLELTWAKGCLRLFDAASGGALDL